MNTYIDKHSLTSISNQSQIENLIVLALYGLTVLLNPTQKGSQINKCYEDLYDVSTLVA